MKHLLKNTYLWGFVLFFVGISMLDPQKASSGLLMVFGFVLLIVSAVRSFLKLINGKTKINKIQETPAQPHKPFIVPNEYMGGILSYSYDDVQIEVAEQNMSRIYTVPDHTQLSFKRYDDDHRIELYKDDLLIGSMYDNKLLGMAFDFLKKPDKNVIAVLISSNPVTIGLYFYNPISSELKRMENVTDSKVFKLVSNRNNDMQESIESCEEGDSVDFDYDYDKEKYLVSAGPWDIGYMPSGFNSYKEKHQDVTGRIYEIVEPEDDDEKYSVSVIVIPENR